MRGPNLQVVNCLPRLKVVVKYETCQATLSHWRPIPLRIDSEQSNFSSM
jgi:hypothetical protein